MRLWTLGRAADGRTHLWRARRKGLVGLVNARARAMVAGYTFGVTPLVPLAAAVVVLAACSQHRPIPAAPPPLRPTPIPLAAPPPVAPPVGPDCEVVDPRQGDPAVPFVARNIGDADALAAEGGAKLTASESVEVDRRFREALLTEAVGNLIDALRADPYNVAATYDLSRAYAEVGRRECALNLLARMIAMRGHASRAAAVAERLNRLFGVRTPLDPAFSELRATARFRDLVATALTMPPTGPVPQMWIPPGGWASAPARAPVTPAAPPPPPPATPGP